MIFGQNHKSIKHKTYKINNKINNKKDLEQQKQVIKRRIQNEKGIERNF